MKRREVLALSAALGLAAVSTPRPARATVTMTDRGALTGSAEGRIWSRVADEVGNTQGAAEVWHLGPARFCA